MALRGYKMFLEALLPVFSIGGLGIGILYFLSIRYNFNLSKGDFFLAGILLGEFFLIVPMGILGILTKDGLWTISRLYFITAAFISTGMIYHFVVHNFHHLETLHSPLPEEWTGEHILALLVGVFLLEYLFLLMIYPLWGFDAIERYLPDAFYYYQQDSIPKINALTASPTFKPPAHTLLFTYVLYVSGTNEYYLIPFLTLFSLVVLAYKFGEVFLGSSRSGWLSALLVLVLPLSRQLMTVWAYYQDLYVAFYFAAAIYFFLLACRRHRLGYSVISGLSIGLAILTKMSGWTLPFVLLLITPTGRRGKALKVMILIPISSWLAMKATSEIFVGVAVAISFVTFLLILLIYSNSSESASTIHTTVPFLIGILGGSWWMLRNKILLSESTNHLLRFYFQIQGFPQWEYPVSPSDKEISVIESLHSVDFLGTCLILLVSSWFATGWVIPKIIGLIETQNCSVFSIWCLSFLMIWFAYYFIFSIRYLSVVIVPLVLLTAKGINGLYERVLRGKIPLLGLEVTLLALATYQMRHRILWHYWRGFSDIFEWTSHPLEVLLIFVMAFTAIIAILVVFWNQSSYSSDQLRFQIVKYDRNLLVVLIIGFLMIATIVAPVGGEIRQLDTVEWDNQRFAEQFVYEYRPAFQDIANAIIRENLPDASIIGANIFGLEFFVQQPVIDLFWGGKPLVSKLFDRENVTEGIELFEDYEVRFIIGLKKANPQYDQFQAEIATQTYIFDVVRNNHYFRDVLTNEEFFLYRILTYNSFQGLVNLKLITSDLKTNILGETGEFRSKTSPNLIATIDLTNLKWNRAICTANLAYAVGMYNYSVKTAIDFSFSHKFLKINLFKLPPKTSLLGDLKLVFDLFDSTGAFLEKLIFEARPKGEAGQFPVNYDSYRNVWFVTSGEGYRIV